MQCRLFKVCLILKANWVPPTRVLPALNLQWICSSLRALYCYLCCSPSISLKSIGIHCEHPKEYVLGCYASWVSHANRNNRVLSLRNAQAGSNWKLEIGKHLSSKLKYPRIRCPCNGFYQRDWLMSSDHPTSIRGLIMFWTITMFSKVSGSSIRAWYI